MKKIKIVSLIAMLIFGNAAFAQRGIELTLKYNTDSEKYEIYARSNFTQRNFLWGPSQITVVMPSIVADEKIRVLNSDGGTWENNTSVFAPGSDPEADYHSMMTLGAKTDLVEGNETLLFSFSLPKNVDPKKVKLFENGKSPNSSAKGMKGGDFSNSINDALSDEVYLRNYSQVKKETGNQKGAEIELNTIESNQFSLYPNTTKDNFKIGLTNIKEDEELTMIVVTETGREVMNMKASKKNLVEKTFKLPSDLASQILVVKVITANEAFSKKLMLYRD